MGKTLAQSFDYTFAFQNQKGVMHPQIRRFLVPRAASAQSPKAPMTTSRLKILVTTGSVAYLDNPSIDACLTCGTFDVLAIIDANLNTLKAIVLSAGKDESAFDFSTL
ncbi:uncharacterized protein FFB14_07033 [Fusarium fujikuroi]|nr:uncharacterized protein FFB14_07033 [Fusarium fujikuroi]